MEIENRLNIIGKKVVLTEIEPKYFADIVKWRNDDNLNNYHNPPAMLRRLE